jgi:hypothetical protein
MAAGFSTANKNRTAWKVEYGTVCDVPSTPIF